MGAKLKDVLRKEQKSDSPLQSHSYFQPASDVAKTSVQRPEVHHEQELDAEMEITLLSGYAFSRHPGLIYDNCPHIM